MRPRRLTVTAFGPFAGTVEVDFGRLEGRELLLIEGPTGAGKTSLLDAMTYALFGSVPGARHEVESDLRSAFAEPAAVCEVTFEFALGERVYRARRQPKQERARKRGGGKMWQQPEAHLYEIVDGVERPVCAPKVNEVDAAVQRLLGLSVEQFKQVLLLPQGEFREFLLARSNDKEELLEKLFGTFLYKDVAERLGLERRALERRCQDLGKLEEELLAQRGVASIDELTTAAAQAAVEVAAAEKIAQKAVANARRAGDRHGQATVLADKLAAREKARQDAREAEASHVSGTAARAALADAERAEPVGPALAAVTREREREGRLAEAAGVAQSAFARATAEALAVEQRAAVLPGLRAELERLAGRDAVLLGLEPVAAEREAALARHTAATGRRQAAAAALAALDADEAKTQATQAALVERLAQASARSAELTALTDAAATAAARAERRRELAEAHGREQGAGHAQAEKQAAVLALRAQVAEASAAMTLRREAREANLAAELAHGLRDGSPCPVCGSAAHPAPARAGAGAVSAEHVTEAERRHAALAARLAKLEAELAGIEAEQRGHRERAAALVQALGVVEPLEAAQAAAVAAITRRDQARQAAADVAAIARERDGLAGQQAAHASARRAAGDALAQASAELETVTARGKELAARLAEALPAGDTLAAARAALVRRRTELERELATLEAAQLQARAAHAAAGAQHQQAAAAAAEQALVRAEAVQAADALARAHGFADAAEAAGRRLPPAELQARRAQLVALDRLRSSITDRLAAADAALAGADMAALADARDLAGRTAEKLAADKIAAAASERLGTARAQAAELQRAAQTIAQRAAQHARLDAELRVLGQLARVCAGDNPLKMSLGRYVLAARMEEVALAASERFFAMSRGRYRLRRTDEVRHAGRGSGLDLVVDDAMTGGERFVHSLSGGEMFLASLSLAMGLADVVQAHAGGIRLDSLFIDEGFGSLDDETLDQVLRTLEDLRAGGRLVGLISHVSELKERLPVRLTVVKGTRGSSVRLVV